MKARAMDSLDAVEMVMAIEETFEVTIFDVEGGTFDSPREIVDWPKAQLSNQQPNKVAREMLRKLARDQQRPELAEGFEGTWRREQIAAIVQEIFR